MNSDDTVGSRLTVGIAFEPVAIGASLRGLSVCIALVRLECGALHDAFTGMSALGLLGVAGIIKLATDGVVLGPRFDDRVPVDIDWAPGDEAADRDEEEEP